MAATITWRGGNGLWSQQGQWNPAGQPNAAQDAQFSGGSYAVTLDSTGSALDVALSSGITLDITGELDLGGTLSLAAGATLQLHGILSGGTLLAGAGSVTAAGGTLENVAVPGGFAGLGGISIDAATVANTVASGGSVAVSGTLGLLGGTYDNVAFQLDQTLGGVTLLSAADAAVVVIGAGASVLLSQDSSVVLFPLASTVAGFAGGGSFVNDGTILSSVGNPLAVPLQIASAGFTNNATVQFAPLQVPESNSFITGYTQGPHGTKTPIYGMLDWTEAFAPQLNVSSALFSNTGKFYLGGGTLDFTGAALDNAGLISLYDVAAQTVTADPFGVSSVQTVTLSTELDIGPGVTAFSNTGTITADRIVLAGTATLAGLGVLQGALEIGGVLDLGGGTLDASQYSSLTISGTLENGVLAPGGGDLRLTGATLANMVIAPGSLTQTGPVTLIDPPGGSSVTLDAVVTTLRLTGGNTDLHILAGSTAASDAIVLPSGGSETFGAASTLDLTVPGGTLTIGAASATLVNNGLFNIDGGTLIMAATLDGGGRIVLSNGGAATLEALAVTAAPTIAFGNGTGLLVLPGAGALNIVISGLQAGDAIDFQSVSSTPSGPFGIGGAAAPGAELDVTGASGQTASITLDAPVSGLHFHVVPDGSGGSLVEVACFASGTRIATPRGEVAVQTLRPGDAVRLADGSDARLRWVGCTLADLARHPDAARAAPVRILAGAFAPGLPARDLLLSPEHCIFVDDALIPAALLTNGATIARDDSFARIEYWHLELDRHAILLAEGLPAESYLDTGNRALFKGEAGVRALHPDLSNEPEAAALSVWMAHGAAPLRLDAADSRARLIERAEALGWRRESDAGLTLACEAGMLHASTAPPGVRCLLPAGTQRVWLHSRSFVAAETQAGSGDTRRLGVAVRAALLAGWPLHQDAFRTGWHARRGNEAWRWSNGAACLVLPRLAKPTALELQLAGAAQYWAGPERGGAADTSVAAAARVA